MARRPSLLAFALTLLLGVGVAGQAGPDTTGREAMDRHLLDVTVARLQRLYAERSYTVVQVVQWHLERIDRYNGVYGAIETVFHRQALAQAAQQLSLIHI